MKELNPSFAELGKTACANRTVILGSVIYHRDYAPPRGVWDVSELVQAALLVPQGVGVVVWDCGEYLE
jgi:hypothetical protein